MTNNNTVQGDDALSKNSGTDNTAIGFDVLRDNTTGNRNTATGAFALGGEFANGSNNIAVGFAAGSNLLFSSDNIEIGKLGVLGDSGIICIGTQGTQTATFIAGIRGVPISRGAEVGVNSSGQLGVRASSARYKDAIKSMDKVSEAIPALKPVTFRYKHELDPEGIPQFGLVAEDVEK